MSSSNSNSRKRNWFITVNQGADCYEDFEQKRYKSRRGNPQLFV